MRHLLALLLVLLPIVTSADEPTPPPTDPPVEIVNEYTGTDSPLENDGTSPPQALIPTTCWVPPNVEDYLNEDEVGEFMVLLNDLCRKYCPDGYDLKQFTMANWSIAIQESGCNQKCRGGSGEIGCMQILPDGAEIKRKYALRTLAGNLECGIEWFTYGLVNRAGGDYFSAFVWYNAGTTRSSKGRRYARSVSRRMESMLEAPDDLTTVLVTQ